MKKIKIIIILLLIVFRNNLYPQDSTKHTNKIITKIKTVDCSLDLVWWKWTTHEGLKTFFGEDNKIQLSVGGTFEIYFSLNEPIGNRGSEGCKVLSYLPKEILSFSWSAPPSFPKIRNSEIKTHVVVQFKSINAHQTEIKLSHLGWLEGDDWKMLYNYFNNAWEIVLNSMAESCK
jgi:uncharacterized protein YndB with AHSA1/START domain